MAVARDTPDAGMVPKCQVRHLGTLGSTMRGRLRRLDGTRDVHGGKQQVQIPRGALRTPLGVRL